jgi:hypothetical protein
MSPNHHPFSTPTPDALAKLSRMSQAAIQLTRIFEKTVSEAKASGHLRDRQWKESAALLDTANFVRVGNFMDRQSWPEYAAILTKFVESGHEIWCRFIRINEVGNLVFLELEEHVVIGDKDDMFNSLTVYEFNDEGKIRHLDVWHQHSAR